MSWKICDPPKGLYLVTTINEKSLSNKRVEISRFGGKGWYANHDGRVVVAWDYLPEPYKFQRKKP